MTPRVDPFPKVSLMVQHFGLQYFSMTSDRFFGENDSLLRDTPVDVAFIDGQHTFQQSLRDVENCLEYLSDRSIILIHDYSPTSLPMANPRGVNGGSRAACPNRTTTGLEK